MNAKHNWTNKSKINNEFNAEKRAKYPQVSWNQKNEFNL